MKKQAILMSVIAIALAVVGWFILPDQVIVQVGTSGQPTNVIPKILAVLSPLIVSAFGVILYCCVSQEMRRKYMFITIVGYVASVITFVMNLK